MIIGSCPYDECKGAHLIVVAQNFPSLSKEICETCGKDFWMYHSHTNPMAYTLLGFKEIFVLDEETKKFEKRK